MSDNDQDDARLFLDLCRVFEHQLGPVAMDAAFDRIETAGWQDIMTISAAMFTGLLRGMHELIGSQLDPLANVEEFLAQWEHP